MLARLDATDLALLQAAQDRAEQDWREALSVQSATHEAAVAQWDAALRAMNNREQATSAAKEREAASYAIRLQAAAEHEAGLQQALDESEAALVALGDERDALAAQAYELRARSVRLEEQLVALREERDAAVREAERRAAAAAQQAQWALGRQQALLAEREAEAQKVAAQVGAMVEGTQAELRRLEGEHAAALQQNDAGHEQERLVTLAAAAGDLPIPCGSNHGLAGTARVCGSRGSARAHACMSDQPKLPRRSRRRRRAGVRSAARSRPRSGPRRARQRRPRRRRRWRWRRWARCWRARQLVRHAV